MIERDYFTSRNEAEAFRNGITFLTGGDYATVLEKVEVTIHWGLKERRWVVTVTIDDEEDRMVNRARHEADARGDAGVEMLGKDGES